MLRTETLLKIIEYLPCARSDVSNRNSEIDRCIRAVQDEVMLLTKEHGIAEWKMDIVANQYTTNGKLLAIRTHRAFLPSASLLESKQFIEEAAAQRGWKRPGE